MEMRKLHGNRAREADGVEVNLFDDFFVTVRRATPNYPAYLEAVRNEGSRNAEKHRFNGKAPVAENQQAAWRVYAKTIVVGWRGCELDGVDVPFSPENFVRVMTEVPELFPLIEAAANDVANFQDQQASEAGNA